MNLNAVLEIIISLVALFWLMSTACSFVVEAVNSLLLNIRAKALERFVCEMVLGSNKVLQLRSFAKFWRRSNLEPTRSTINPEAGTLADPLGLFSHGLVLALRKPQNIPGGKASPPSYIPAHAFARALLDRLLGLSWGLQAASKPTLDMLNALALSPNWKQRLVAAQQGVSAGAPLLNAAAGLLREVHSKSIAQARIDLQSLIGELNSAATNLALARLSQAPAMPALPVLDSTPRGMRDLVVTVLQAADAAIAALAEGQKEPKKTTLSAVVNADALWMLAVRKAGESITHSPELMDALRSLVRDAPLPASLREALRPLLAEAHFDADKLRAGVEAWYDAVMERATGWFKRYTTLMLGVIGLVAAVGLNVNTIRVAQDLAKDPSLRNAGAAFAEFVVREQGRPQMAQQYRFQDTAQSAANWPARVANLDAQKQLDDCRANLHCELAALAEPMSRLLLTSGPFYGPSRLVPMDGRPAEWDAVASGEEPNDQAFRRRLCHAALAADSSIKKDADLSKLARDWQTQPTCSWVVKSFGKSGNKLDDTRKFWSHGTVVWDVPLGKALLEALEAPHLKPEVDAKEMNKRLDALKSAYSAAQMKAANVHAQAQAYLDRIPSLGRSGVVNWTQIDSIFPGGWPLDIVGWLLTAVMVSFGASFWFDLLSNLVDRRATGPKPEVKAG
jgi:hypothetical protein